MERVENSRHYPKSFPDSWNPPTGILLNVETLCSSGLTDALPSYRFSRGWTTSTQSVRSSTRTSSQRTSCWLLTSPTLGIWLLKLRSGRGQELHPPLDLQVQTHHKEVDTYIHPTIGRWLMRLQSDRGQQCQPPPYPQMTDTSLNQLAHWINIVNSLGRFYQQEHNVTIRAHKLYVIFFKNQCVYGSFGMYSDPFHYSLILK